MTDCEEIERQDNTKQDTSLTVEGMTGAELLRLARTAIQTYLLDGTIPDDKEHGQDTSLPAGLFVTLWTIAASRKDADAAEQPTLRGCIGHLQSDLALPLFVQQVAIGAAIRDPRFPPLSLKELETTRIEIAILSPFRTITDLQQISIGQDGLMVEGSGRRGLLLPKVALRFGWDQLSFFNAVCDKAGLPAACWPSSCQLYAFTTIVFEEAKLGH